MRGCGDAEGSRGLVGSGIRTKQLHKQFSSYSWVMGCHERETETVAKEDRARKAIATPQI